MRESLRFKGSLRFKELLPIGSVITIVGFVGAFTLPFLPLYLNTAVHASPVRTAVFLFLAAGASVALGSVLARFSDRGGRRRQILLLALCAGVLGYAAYGLTRSYALLLIVAVTFVAASGAGFPQGFALARDLLDKQGSTHAPAVTNALRMLVSLAWVVGPPVAAFVLSGVGFTGFYLTVAAGYALAALIVLRMPRVVSTVAPIEGGGGGMLLPAIAFTLIQCAAALGTLAMSLYVTHDLGGSVNDAGWILAVCAILEIPLMLGMGALTARFPLRRLVIVGTAVGVAYYATVAVAHAGWQVGVAQLLNACFVAAAAGLGISYFQELRPGEAGKATTTFANTQRVSNMLAGPILGLAQGWGYRTAYIAGAVLCAAGLLILVATPARAGAVARPVGDPAG
ncbi:putative sugar efflux transporter [Virgisporangium aliadipatigenens]|uniref:Putative sugar efflux transporter n=1 Tax=Virgisporangium aliadipatigenens TaxID=741659 RepID=A0A8J3YT55_9ACTN|nr:sugar efflux transporter [Virgisporangium aliadipatigenens]GIJ49356.1 putative sugar efflux transporter [Virgisporangium aliadipatigenens]